MREAVMQKVPFILVLGQKEVDDKLISYRRRGSQDTITVSYDEFIDLLKKEIKEHK